MYIQDEDLMAMIHRRLEKLMNDVRCAGSNVSNIRDARGVRRELRELAGFVDKCLESNAVHLEEFDKRRAVAETEQIS